MAAITTPGSGAPKQTSPPTPGSIAKSPGPEQTGGSGGDGGDPGSGGDKGDPGNLSNHVDTPIGTGTLLLELVLGIPATLVTMAIPTQKRTLPRAATQA